jgi:cation diffusion facilitator family transporter
MNEQNSQLNIRLQIVVVSVGAILMATKFVAWALTNSNAILTDALESIINVLAGAFGLYSLFLTAKPKDRNHPYGHGKIEFISAGFEGGLIFLAGVLIVAKAGYNLFEPQQLSQLGLGIWLVVIPAAINLALALALLRQSRRARSLILEASGRHLLSDVYSSAGLIAGLIVLYFSGLAWLDNLIAIVFGLIILWSGFRLVRASIAGIMDEADYQLIGEMVKRLRRHRSPDWIDVHNFRVIKYGATLHIDCHLTLPYFFTVEQSHREISHFGAFLAEYNGAPVELFVHADPCEPPHDCAICHKVDCPAREAPFQHTVPWSLDNFMINRKHHMPPDKNQE